MEVWKSADQAKPAITGPDGRGWKIVEGALEVHWNKEDPLPKELVDILCDESESHAQEDESDFELINICDAVQEEGFDEND